MTCGDCGSRQQTRQPSRGQGFTEIGAGGKDDVDLAVRAVRATVDGGPWGHVTATEVKTCRRIRQPCYTTRQISAPSVGTLRYQPTRCLRRCGTLIYFTKNLRGLVPGPHKIWLANPKLSKTIVPTGAYFQTQSTLTKAEIEIATNVINGRWLAAYSNYEHETIGEKLGGLPPEKVEALIAGLPTSFDDPRHQVVYELASTLVQPRVCRRDSFAAPKP